MITCSNIIIGDYIYYDDVSGTEDFEKNQHRQVLHKIYCIYFMWWRKIKEMLTNHPNSDLD